MRGDLESLDVVRPRRLADALAALEEAPHALPLAGGTDLFVALNAGQRPAGRFVDLSALEELGGIVRTRDAIALGALTTYTELRRSALVRRALPVLAAMASSVGAVAIQNRGTLGGSLGNASPASDPAPVLMALDARVELARRAGRRIERRTIPLEELFVDYRRTARAPEELIVRLLIPATALVGWRYAYRKVGTRQAQAISKVVVAAGASLEGRPREFRDARIALGSVAPTPVRAHAAEGAVVGRPCSPPTSRAAAHALLATDIRPIDDVRSTADYRRLVAARVLEELLGDLGHFEPAFEL